jgi:hypothetical protein
VQTALGLGARFGKLVNLLLGPRQLGFGLRSAARRPARLGFLSARPARRAARRDHQEPVHDLYLRVSSQLLTGEQRNYPTAAKTPDQSGGQR